MPNNRKTRKLEEIQTSNALRRRGIAKVALKVSAEALRDSTFNVMVDVVPHVIPCYGKRIDRKFIYKYKFHEIGSVEDDFARDLKAMLVTFSATRKTISQ